MATARTTAAARKLVPIAAESSSVTVTGVKRVRLSKATAARPDAPPKPNGVKPKKLKPVSNRYKIPDHEYAQLGALKKRLLALGSSTKRSELLRAGLMLLVAMDDAQLKKAVAKVENIRARRSTENAG